MTLGEFLGDWAPFVLLLCIAAVLSILSHLGLVRLQAYLARATRAPWDEAVVRALRPAFVLAAFVAIVWAAVRLFGARLPPHVAEWMQAITLALVALLVAVAVARLLGGLLRARARAQPRYLPAATVGSRLLAVVVYATAFLVVLDAYGLSITPLLTSLGIAGLAVALALQDTLSNAFAGIWVQTGRSLRPGHFVRLEDARVEGTVVEVGWRTTILRTGQNNWIVVPNARLAQNVITDYHLPETRTMVQIQVPVAYGAEPAVVERALVDEANQAMDQVPGLLRAPAPAALLIPGFTEAGLVFTLNVFVREWADNGLVQHELRKRIAARLRSEGVRMGHPSRESRGAPGTGT